MDQNVLSGKKIPERMFFQKNILSDSILIRDIRAGPYLNYTCSCVVHYTTAHVP
jgi:hypothetical protein